MKNPGQKFSLVCTAFGGNFLLFAFNPAEPFFFYFFPNDDCGEISFSFSFLFLGKGHFPSVAGPRRKIFCLLLHARCFSDVTWHHFALAAEHICHPFFAGKMLPKMSQCLSTNKQFSATEKTYFSHKNNKEGPYSRPGEEERRLNHLFLARSVCLRRIREMGANEA